MKATWLDGNDAMDAQGAEGPAISPEELAREGIHYQRLEVLGGAFQPALDSLKQARGYSDQDTIELTPQTPNLESLSRKFIDEHRHGEDEVRFVVDGAGVFDIRSRSDRWMRVEVEPGDLIVVPKNRYHRFCLTETRCIQCVRLFKDKEGWVPHYRGDAVDGGGHEYAGR